MNLSSSLKLSNRRLKDTEIQIGHKMVSKIISGSILPVVIIIFLNSGTDAAILRGDIIDVEKLNLEPNTDPDDYHDQGELFRPGNDWTYRKFKRQAPVQTGRDMKKLIRITPEKLGEILRLLNKPKKSETLTLKGWSASGMPFNVLYTPNSLQQKLLSSNSARRYAPSPSTQIVAARENPAAERKHDRKQNLPPGTQPTNKSLPLRKHYLVIPQLFLSYGWGSLGK